MALSYIVMALPFAGFALIRSPLWLPLFSVIKGLGYGIWIGVTIRMVTGRTAKEYASAALSLITLSLFGAAPLVAEPLGGVLHDSVSPAGVFWLAAGSLGLALGVLATAKGVAAPKRREREVL